ncbi:MAG: patatin family protein [Clostridium fessum]
MIYDRVKKKKKRPVSFWRAAGCAGIYTAGVLDVFLDHDISFDGVIGVSAGAVHGASFVSGQKERSIRYYKKYCNDKRFMSFKNWLRTGNLVDEQFCFHDIPERLDPYDYEAFDRGDTRFYVACSNVETGKAEYLEIKDMFKDVEYFRATASLPYVSHMVEVGGMKLLDGGCTGQHSDCVRSLRWAIKMRRCADPSSGLPQETGQFLAAGGGISQISGVREGASQPLLFL